MQMVLAFLLTFGCRIVLASTLTIVLAACAGQEEASDEFVVNRPVSEVSGAWVVFVEAHDAESGLESGAFGDVVLFNPKTRKKTYVTKDSFADVFPCLSPDGKHLAFASARVDRPELTRVMGLAARQGLYIADLEKGTAGRLGMKTAGDNPRDWLFFQGLSWAKSSRALYYLSSDSVLFVLPTPSESLFVFASCPRSRLVRELSVSDDDSLFAVMYLTTPPESLWNVRPSLAIYDAPHGLWSQALSSRRGLTGIGGWAPDGKSLMVTTWDSLKPRLWRFDAERRAMEAVRIPTNEWQFFRIEPPYFESPHTIIFLASYRSVDQKSADASRRTDVFRLDLEQNRLDRLTDDGVAKSMLKVTIVR